ncbi:putative cytochrome P450 [Viridothelium virens]|uniref:Putative cytochrome P450 n=1 Tax=Viridothelium virens TaxID=1048519 RepID=A0A6A6HEU8_VIRVR|nr:putative cytochrome P450 [Viridothelium virens]
MAIPSVQMLQYLLNGRTLLTFFLMGLYNLFFHPLRKFPGPWTAAVSNYQYCHWFLGGKQPCKILQLHEKYGSVVRIASNDLSFNSATSWRDIYEYRPSHKPFLKSTFYEGGSFADKCGSIVSERDPVVHNSMRRYLSQAFSQGSLTDQEYLISDVIDKSIKRIGMCSEEGIDIAQWFTRMTFDIIGDLAFGETFHGIESGETHPWIARITGAMTKGAIADCFARFPAIAKVLKTLIPGTIESAVMDTKINEKYSIELVNIRISKDTSRKDFFTRILKERDPEKVSDIQVAAHASDFVVAGSETTATCLACITYYLLTSPVIATKLKEEIRNTFTSYSQISAASTTSLEYLNAVILEGLRIYPPLPFALPRLVPEGGDTVDGHFIPAGTTVSTNPIAASLSPANFENPFNFEPNRWLSENEKDNLAASQPFSLGPRGCIGKSLGWMELRTTLAKLHWTCNFELISRNLDWHRDSRMHTLWQKPELRVRIKPRQD